MQLLETTAESSPVLAIMTGRFSSGYKGAANELSKTLQGLSLRQSFLLQEAMIECKFSLLFPVTVSPLRADTCVLWQGWSLKAPLWVRMRLAALSTCKGG